MIGAWKYEDGPKVYGDDVTYEKGARLPTVGEVFKSVVGCTMRAVPASAVDGDS